MEGASEELLRPLGAAEPCGADVRSLAAFDVLRSLIDDVDKAHSTTQITWAREQERVLELAGRCRDLRVWVWLARSRLATEGLAGFAASLELMAAGLERYWDMLPPYDPEDAGPRERFMGRLAALSFVGGSNFQTSDRDLLGRRSMAHFLRELDTAVGQGAGSGAAPALAARIEQALGAIVLLFKERFGPAADPQLGFAQVLQRLAALKAAPESGQAGAEEAVPASVQGRGPAGPIASRAEVVAVLDRVLDYYARQEPCSPVPLLVGRAKRLVAMSFLEAIRDLAPGGLKELQALAGTTDEKAR